MSAAHVLTPISLPTSQPHAIFTVRPNTNLENVSDWLTTLIVGVTLIQIGKAEGRLRFTKLDGSQRPNGDIYPDDGHRMIFLGTMTLGDEARSLPYGRDAERDMAGIVERVGPRRWRIAFPYPHWESTIDVLELVPKG